ncbi:baseplate J/gp47 family protein [Hymenobacter negativus]|uniref:Baseplate J/gp47 family protein n=1 Tax=Hymenobacter negativus TaxID=2795026 RepID=A0ABS3QKQ5_9BACT|nr:baseplate J/gp47 family protein [Hymenobacter negativus]MBO2011558.1 baseplate J/gp47 family protein [Hymenobacter negativus]
MPADCTQNTDPLKLVREGTSQPQRVLSALAPASAPLNERTPAHSMVFAQAYARYLNYDDGSGALPLGTWEKFFAEDVSVQLAVAAVQDVEQYKVRNTEAFGYLNNLDNEGDEAGLKRRLGFLFSAVGTLAARLDALQTALPNEIPLKGLLLNLIQSQLATGLGRLVAYHKGGVALGLLDESVLPAEAAILGGPLVSFQSVRTKGLSAAWWPAGATSWANYESFIADDLATYGVGSDFERINRLATHNLFTSVFDQFLKVYARVATEGRAALEATLTKWDGHEPHYALFLAFLRLNEYARQETNTLTQRHLDFYYRDILQLREKPAEPSHAHLLLELAKHVEAYALAPGELFKAGKDALGKPAFFASDEQLVANAAQVTALKTLYRYGTEPAGSGWTGGPAPVGRLYAAPVANSDDGLGAPLTSTDGSWQPFFHKIYVDGQLTEIKMPTAEVGLALASHYLFLAEGARTITVDFTVTGSYSDLAADVVYQFTAADGWFEKPATSFKTESGQLRLVIELTGADPAIVAYNTKAHGYTFATALPLLLLKLKQQPTTYQYQQLQDARLSAITLSVAVTGLRTLAVSNDFGPVDTSKPFQPFGALPVAGSALTIGSAEAFQKTLTSAAVELTWQAAPAPYGTTPQVAVDFLTEGNWEDSGTSTALQATEFDISSGLTDAVVDQPNPLPTESYGTTARHGFVRLRLTDGFGQAAYQTALLAFLSKTPATATNPGAPPAGPVVSALTLSYTASQSIALSSADAGAFARRAAQFYHVAPFGQAEQHPFLKIDAPDKALYLLPQFKHLNLADPKLPAQQPVPHEAEFYIGISALLPPQNLALLFQVADGTADPLTQKPVPHLNWSYLRRNEWVEFPRDAVADTTSELTRSGIVTLAVPRDANDDNTLLPNGQHWLRVAVAEKSAAVCQLLLVAAQAVRVTFQDQGNDPAFAAQVTPAGTITKMAQPVAAVKKVEQPFDSFGGRGSEASDAFYTRVSERLRHKDRAVALWDYEHLVLEAFPQLYQVKCLNHTHYESSANGTGIYRELAPGHVTLVAIPSQQLRNLRDPLRPYTSLGLLREIGAFLQQRLSCFVKLHVKNPEFEEVRVAFRVRLREGFDETFSIKQLQQSITRFLSPWAFADGAGPSFGGKIYKSVLINFIEDQTSVDYVTDFQLFHPASGPADYAEITGTKAVSILVSAPATQHSILVINPAQEEAPHENCPCTA